MKRWTQEELKFVKNNMNEMTNKEIGKVLKRSKGNVKNIMQYYGIRRSRKIIKKFLANDNSKKRIKYKRVPCIYLELSDCWINTSHYKQLGGYPHIMRNNKSFKMARYIWKLYFGEIPEGMSILHKCDTPECINPDHLFLGTQKDNMIDMVEKGRWNGGRKKIMIV